jgi:hypothetical protein
MEPRPQVLAHRGRCLWPTRRPRFAQLAVPAAPNPIRFSRELPFDSSRRSFNAETRSHSSRSASSPLGAIGGNERELRPRRELHVRTAGSKRDPNE